jgi:hypothetical protein
MSGRFDGEVDAVDLGVDCGAEPTSFLKSILGGYAHIFFAWNYKIFILNELLAGDRLRSPQNLELKELTRKIFWNKGLAPV